MSRCSYRLMTALSALLVWSAPVVAAESEIYTRALGLVQEHYLYLDDFDPLEALELAAEAAEDAVPWLIAETQEGTVTLKHGESGVFAVVKVDVSPREAVAGLPASLQRLEDAVRAGGPVPEDVDLPVTLLRGAARALDRHSVVLAKDRLERFDQRIRGKLTGVGARIRLRGGKLLLEEVFPTSPAEAAGLLAGDVVARIDGVAVLGMTLSQAIDRIRGLRGTQVQLQIERGNLPEVRDVVLTRDEVVIPTVTWSRLPSGVGLIRVDHFSEHTAGLLEQALEAFRADPVSGILLDLRGNTGGSMIQACRSVDAFVTSGVILQTEGRGGERVDNLLREYRAHAADTEQAAPVIVLVDRKSASASEILAGSLSLLGRAVLLGEDTHGKGTVQKLYTLRGGGAGQRARLKLTVARYLLADGVPIQSRVGLAPDVVVERARLGASGVRIPKVPSAVPLSIQWVDEQPGWRAEAPPAGNLRDFEIDLAEAVLLQAASAAPADLLQAADRVIGQRAGAEDARLVEAFAARGLDWRAAESAGPEPDLSVRVWSDAPVRAGAPAEIKAEVTNHGDTAVARTLVHLRGPDRRAPWRSLQIPIGHLAPGASLTGSMRADAKVDLPTREDRVSVVVSSDQRPLWTGPDAVLRSEARPVPVLGLSARLAPMEEGQLRAELELTNHSNANLLDVTARLALPTDPSVELLEPEANAGRLAPGETTRADLFLRALGEDLDPVELEVRVSTAVFGTVLKVPVDLALDGSAAERQAPQAEIALSSTVDAGPRELVLTLRDDEALSSVTTWVGRQKVGWQRLTGTKVVVRVPVDLPPGTHRLYVDVQDSDGSHTRQEAVVQAVERAVAEDDRSGESH